MKKLLSVLLVLTLILSACTSNNEGGDLSYETEKGTISYKDNPKIYADYYVGQLLYLDADLVGADMTYPVETWAPVAEERGVENVSGDMEAVALLKPELIITIKEDLYDQYSAIAPTIYLPYGTYNQEDIVLEIGKILNKEDVAIEWQEQFNKDIEKLKKDIKNPKYTVGIVDSFNDGIYMYGANYGRGGYILYTKLGFNGTEDAERDYIRKTESYATVDGETFTKYAGDVLYITDDGNGNVETITEVPTYKTLDAVKNDRVIKLDREVFLYDDPYSLDEQIKSLTTIFEENNL